MSTQNVPRPKASIDDDVVYVASDNVLVYTVTPFDARNHCVTNLLVQFCALTNVPLYCWMFDRKPSEK